MIGTLSALCRLRSLLVRRPAATANGTQVAPATLIGPATLKCCLCNPIHLILLLMFVSPILSLMYDDNHRHRSQQTYRDSFSYPLIFITAHVKNKLRVLQLLNFLFSFAQKLPTYVLQILVGKYNNIIHWNTLQYILV